MIISSESFVNAAGVKFSSAVLNLGAACGVIATFIKNIFFFLINNALWVSLYSKKKMKISNKNRLKVEQKYRNYAIGLENSQKTIQNLA